MRLTPTMSVDANNIIILIFIQSEDWAPTHTHLGWDLVVNDTISFANFFAVKLDFVGFD